VIDLHVHSKYSDGTKTPGELVALAKKEGLSALALTDHDTVGGIEEFMSAGAAAGLETIPGIELSAQCERGTMHILGYFIDHTHELLREKLQRIREGRDKRNYEILKRLNKLGYLVMWSDIEAQAGKDVVGRPHIAAALLARGHVRTKKDAFNLLLARGRPGYVERFRYTPKECIELIRRVGGVPVLAHPSTITVSDIRLRELIRDMKDTGLAGIEVYYSEHQPENILKYKHLAEDFGLICTGGTDFHGDLTPDIRLGRGFGELKVPKEAVEQLKAARQLPVGN